MRTATTLTAMLLAVVLGIAACTDTSAPPAGGAVAHAEEAQLAGDGVTVEAVGTVEGTPDVLTALVGVEVRGGDVDRAFTEGNRTARAVRDALLDAGVDEADVQTAQLSLRPDRRGGRDDAADRYVSRTQLRVTLRDLDAAGAVLDDAVAAADGNATLRSLGFSLDDDSDLVVAAREAAFAEARAKAEQYADLAGRSLGDLVGLAEASHPRGPIPQPVPRVEADMVEAPAGPPVEPGEEAVAVRIRATWVLE